MSVRRQTLNCAIYTRKSSEEGLEQGFNSLDAQREACEAFVLSQQHEGWRALSTRYDDGGYSGGNMGRPALQQLLADIDSKRIQVVVVYKVDRLTRSLADFAKIVEQFDARGVSFVSVTQQFNTTSSMGRLTLNVLLSFAQFEREVTGERIRDKIAASKQKGMWMGGVPPLGYIGQERTLAIDEPNADLVRSIYQRYLALGCVSLLQQELASINIRTPSRSSRTGNTRGGRHFSRGHLYRILTSPVYIGRIVHRDQVYPGQHPAIIEPAQWDAVQSRMMENRQGHTRQRSTPSDSLLTGLIYDEQGHRMIPSHSRKQSKRFRYYVTETLITAGRAHAPSGIRLPAQEIETLVINRVRDWLGEPAAVLESLGDVEPAYIQEVLSAVDFTRAGFDGVPSIVYRSVRTLVERVTVESIQVRITLAPHRLLAANRLHVSQAEIIVPARITRCGLAIRLVVQGGGANLRPAPDQGLITLIGKAHDWLGRLTSGKVRRALEIANEEGVTASYVLRTIQLGFLAPDIVRAILNGTQPATLTLKNLKQSIPLPIDWSEQKKLLGFDQS
ncbi:recombinase family protein [Ferriphaselus sp. R-1]|uniref:recombinase family protein n=1 Tax=Ferriphaselus sp. R-1 TaxID=1485544 RepID=UPI00054E891E|nr:recombinase family protein [Ferriphaselus sp. R-1]